MNREKEPLYRKVNTTTRNHHHGCGPDSKHDRNTKKGISKNLKRGEQRGLDHTPLYKFLRSKIGEDWNIIHSETISRLDSEDPIWQIVILDREKDKRIVARTGESSYVNALYIDENNKLQIIDPTLKNEDFSPSCDCCTHTFNGVPFKNKYKYDVPFLNK